MSKYTESFYHNILFSAYSCAVDPDEKPKQSSFLEEMENIKDGEYRKEAEIARFKKANEPETEYKKYKRTKIWCFTPGVNSSKISKATALPEDYTGLLTLDIDNPKQDQNKNKEILKTFPWVIAVSRSVGGEGLFAIIKVDKTRLQESYDSAVQILAEHGVWAAPGQHNVNRLRFASYDPDIYYDHAPGLAPNVPITAFRKSLPQNSVKPKSVSANSPEQNNDREHIFKSIARIVSENAPTWLKDNRHDPLLKLATWCNHIGMSENFCLEMAEKYIRPIMEGGNDYELTEQIQDIYKRYSDQHGTKEWKENSLSPIETMPMKTLEEFDKYRITKEKDIPETPAMITIGSARVAAAGNITPITAEAKAGKTAVTSVFIAGAISKTGDVDGFPEVSVMANPEGRAVIHFDTEQSEADQQYNLNSTLRRAGMIDTPDYFLSYNIRTLALNQYTDFTRKICELAAARFGGIHMLVVDGGADFITSVNDEAEANAIILFFNQLAVDYGCPVILIVHLNENAGRNGDTMPRGHLGRQAVRKGYAQLNITKENDVSVMQALRCRKAGSKDTPLICFKYNPDKGYQTAVDAGELKEEKEGKRDLIERKKRESLAPKVIPITGSLTHTDLVKKIRSLTSKSESTAMRYIKDMLAFDIITLNNGLYRIKLPSNA